MASPTTKLAVLVDAENASPAVAAPLLAEIAKYGTAFARRAYGDWTGTGLRGWKDQLLTLSIQPVQQFAYTQGKNATDSAMIIDAMDLLYSGRFDGFCLVSSDSDFTRLASRIREAGLVVYGCGERKTPRPFVAACTKFIFTENVLKPVEEPAPAAPATDPAASVSALPKAPPPGPLHWLLAATRDTSDDDGWANLASVGGLVNKRHPEFDPRSYGFLKLSDLIIESKRFDIDRRIPSPGKPAVMYVREKRTC
ncbi:hypothetical protein CDD83_8782 [Cordyceps sp. RAO-2017]|nr:hypothetical protein CDD83_8782 [Cordyceps sp. RAO-2017]